MSNELIKHLDNLGCSIVAKPDEYHVEYEIYAHEGYGYNDDDVHYYHKKGADSFDPVPDYHDAEYVFKGSVKWDGCSNWDLNPIDCQFHGCSKEHLINIGLILGEAWEWTKELIPNTWNSQ